MFQMYEHGMIVFSHLYISIKYLFRFSLYLLVKKYLSHFIFIIDKYIFVLVISKKNKKNCPRYSHILFITEVYIRLNVDQIAG